MRPVLRISLCQRRCAHLASVDHTLDARPQLADPGPLPCRWIPLLIGNRLAPWSIRRGHRQLGQLRKQRPRSSIVATRRPLIPAHRIWICRVNSRSLLTRPRCACWTRCVHTHYLVGCVGARLYILSIHSSGGILVARGCGSRFPHRPYLFASWHLMLHCLVALTEWPHHACRQQTEVGALLFDRGQHFPVRPMTHTPVSGQSTLTV